MYQPRYPIGIKLACQTANILYNTVKGRIEFWNREPLNDTWILKYAFPARVWEDRFVSAPMFVPSILGLHSQIPWTVNGRKGGASAPADACFTAANDIGGGFSINVVAAGGAINDYTAVHWGDNYPVILEKSPHFTITLSRQQLTDVATLNGLVDNTRSASTANFALPDNGIFCYYDTAIDNYKHYIIRSGGINVIDIQATPEVAGTPVSCYTQASDDGLSVRFIENGVEILSFTDISGADYTDLRAAQLQPYCMVLDRKGGELKQVHINDFRLIMDSGF